MKNNNYAIFSDATSDLSPELRSRFGVDGYLVSHITLPDGKEQEARLDLTDAELDEFYSSLKANKNGYKTSPASVDEAVAYFETFLKQGKDILAISLSGALSATYNIMLQAQKVVREKHPERKVFVVDSRKYSMGIGLLTVKACQLRAEGHSIEENAKSLEKMKNTIHQMGPIDDLFWVASKGRISHAKAFFGTVMGIKPLGDFGPDGMATVLGKVSGGERAQKVTVEYISKTIKSAEEQIIFVAHSARKKQAEILAKSIQEKIKPKEVIICNVHQASGINIGPGVLVAFYFGTEITDLKFEKQVINELLASKK